MLEKTNAIKVEKNCLSVTDQHDSIISMSDTKPNGLKISNSWQNRLLRGRYFVILLIAVILVTFEILEHPNFLTDIQHQFFLEIGNYLILLLTVGILLEVLIRSIDTKNLALSILDARHNLSLQLTAAQDWDEVVSLVLQYPASIMPVSATSLLRYDSESEFYITERNWVAAHEEINIPFRKINISDCCDCTKKNAPSDLHLINCDPIITNTQEKRLCYCLHIDYGNLSVGILHIFLPQNQKLDPDHVLLLNNTAADIAIILNTAWQRREQLAMEISNAASNERLEIARDLHDTLGQNLGYMHLKLDQILGGQTQPSFAKVRPELDRLRDLANESYELVRSTLTILHHLGNRRLSDLFRAQASQISERTEILIELHEEGHPQVLPPQSVHQLFNIYKEALHNIEKHADAKHVEVILKWEQAKLIVKIHDDGCGFDPQSIDQTAHFGLKFIEDRLGRLGGELKVSSSPNQGTLLEFWVPVTVS